MKQRYSRRLDVLEARAGEKVVGLYCTNPWEGHPDPVYRAGLVRLSGRDEVMTLAEFAQRYSTGTLIRITYTTEWSR